ncbi:hypothetical protein D3C84_910470 [compost metagenome]
MRRLANGLGMLQGLVNPRGGGDEHKFLAAVARHPITRPLGMGRQCLGDPAQAVVTCLMPVVVVIFLEIVDVDQHQ